MQTKSDKEQAGVTYADLVDVASSMQAVVDMNPEVYLEVIS